MALDPRNHKEEIPCLAHKTVATPHSHIEDVTLVPSADGSVRFEIVAEGEGEARVQVLDADGVPVAQAQGKKGTLHIPQAKLWEPWPGTPYLYTARVSYGEDLYELAHRLDPQNRPVTLVGCQNDYTRDITVPSMDVVSINRYYGWYNLSGDLPAAQYALRMELDHWQKLGKPVILSEYGADTVAGLHAAAAEMFTEEFQVAYYEAINACLDERPFVVGEMPWNFADFATQQGPMRAGGNRKGLFTRDRRPKMAAHYFKERWRDFRKGE